jgi:hypothetical protein
MFVRLLFDIGCQLCIHSSCQLCLHSVWSVIGGYSCMFLILYDKIFMIRCHAFDVADVHGWMSCLV